MNAEVIEIDVARLVPESRALQVLARILVVATALLSAALALVPWQQSSAGKGRVIAYAPTERLQTIEAPLDGRIVRWFVHEGVEVKKGDPLVDISDNDADILQRLDEERTAVDARITAARARVEAIDARIRAMESSRQAAVSSADRRTRMGEDRLVAATHAVEASEATLRASLLNLERQRALYQQGLSSKRAMELAEAEEVRARTDLERGRAALSAARSEVSALSADLDKTGNDAFASISDARAARAVAESEIASGLAELARMDVRIARQETQHVRAPADGMILRVIARQGGEMVKMGEPLLAFVPSTEDRAVELWVYGNDVNLIHAGRSVRLQFEGWPAVQVSGWPTLAVGTFAAKVAFVDPTDDGKGSFRVVVVPDGNNPWPPTANLRQGTRVNGWVMLDQVSLGYELWRQFNGFPPEWTDPGTNAVSAGSAGKKS